MAGEWGFLTNHALVLACLARGADVRVRTIAEDVGITLRPAHRIVSELVEAGYVTRRRVGGRNVYQIHPELPLRYRLEQGHEVGELLGILVGGDHGPSVLFPVDS